jgi:hypothetical protein
MAQDASIVTLATIDAGTVLFRATPGAFSTQKGAPGDAKFYAYDRAYALQVASYYAEKYGAADVTVVEFRVHTPITRMLLADQDGSFKALELLVAGNLAFLNAAESAAAGDNDAIYARDDEYSQTLCARGDNSGFIRQAPAATTLSRTFSSFFYAYETVLCNASTHLAYVRHTVHTANATDPHARLGLRWMTCTTAY